ncbi:pyrazinamidase/nicotinamidase [Culex quinquefasciatus]|uniref:nicotinamidase n=1 Tax=Culex quinquefasciatus TaxID=7176 RepID=B0WUY9_CULQU|nr:pyrazinamidase/nicotinamidase [Culex quinquefasciatus]|eukprot:XP_001859965.1 pyrazinamidase/nicotinamidase [Culex quinquefasciatus]
MPEDQRVEVTVPPFLGGLGVRKSWQKSGVNLGEILPDGWRKPPDERQNCARHFRPGSPPSGLERIVRPISAFLIVDVQNDFISGSLNISNCSAQQNGLEVIDPINKLLDTVEFDSVFYSLDWHPSDHVSFIDNIKQRPIHPTSPLNSDNAQVYDTVIFAGPPPMKQRLWPRHCVQDSWGSELHKDLKIVDQGIKVYKGTNPEVDSYSVFWDNKKLSDTTLCGQLRMKGSSDIYVCGLAYDVCVGATAIDALSAGYRTVLIDDCCRGVDVNDIESTKQTVISNNGVIVNSREPNFA